MAHPDHLSNDGVLTMKLTKAIIYAAAFDAAERSKRQRNGAIMDQEASEAFYEELDRLFCLIGGAEGWIDLPSK
jgi:hypothetical protein